MTGDALVGFPVVRPAHEDCQFRTWARKDTPESTGRLDSVSPFDTKSNKAIGQPLIFFDSYADEKLPKLPANNTAFSVTMPKLKANQCTTGGECVLQWHWVGTAAKQTYQSCVDFVQG
ncbi:hypothetical protein MCOR32_009743 [Pyricularia oryzae]|nr:hypothetical protein MCOR32_009743 [Pyricularia oryzae]